MHLYKIRTKSGKEYNEVLVTDKLGEASNPLYTILSGSPRIFVAGGSAKGVVEIPFGEIESAICEKERVSVTKEGGQLHAVLRDTDEFPMWLELYKTYKEHKKELEKLPQDLRIIRVAELYNLQRERQVTAKNKV